jgi:hypothetical protein
VDLTSKVTPVASGSFSKAMQRSATSSRGIFPWHANKMVEDRTPC